jgi:phosphate transport system substrate-binding protein
VPLEASRPFALIDEGAHVKPIRVLAVTALSGVLAFGIAACGDSDSASDGGSSGSSLSGNIKIDGSSTVFPFAQAAAEQFKGENSGVDISVGESGTGGGFEKFCAGETDVSNASRPIKEDEEAPICEKNGVTYSEVQVANDGIAVITSKDLEIECMTTDQLKALWNKDSKISNYKDLDPKFPDEKVALFGPGTDSGTFDFFTAEINGEEGDTRKDYSPSEDDNVTVQGVSGDKGGLGYLGFSYFEDNADNLNLVKVDAGDGCVEPSAATIQDGTYKPLARPLFMYPAAKSIARPEVKGFMDYVLANQQAIADASKIVAMTEEQATKAKADLTKAES